MDKLISIPVVIDRCAPAAAALCVAVCVWRVDSGTLPRGMCEKQLKTKVEILTQTLTGLHENGSVENMVFPTHVWTDSFFTLMVLNC